MDRKDNIYITRRNRTDASIELLNYASEIKRNDVKKSDVMALCQLSWKIFSKIFLGRLRATSLT